MFDIGFGELLLVMVIGLVVLGPERLPVAVKTVSGWIRALRSLASSVQHELSQELKLQELQESLKKVEQVGLQNLTPEFKASMDELKEVTESLKRSYHGDSEPLPHTIHNTEATDPEAFHDEVAQVNATIRPTAPVPSIVEPALDVAAKTLSPAPVAPHVQSTSQPVVEPVANKPSVPQPPSGEL